MRPRAARSRERRHHAADVGIGIAMASVVMAVGTLLVLDAGLPGGLIDGTGDIGEARTLAFNTLVLFQLVDVVCIRSDTRRSRSSCSPTAGCGCRSLRAGAAAGVLYVPALQAGVRNGGVCRWRDWIVCVAVASTIIVASEVVKAVWRGVDRRVTSA